MGNTFTSCFKCCYTRKPRPLIEEYELHDSERDLISTKDYQDQDKDKNKGYYTEYIIN